MSKFQKKEGSQQNGNKKVKTEGKPLKKSFSKDKKSFSKDKNQKSYSKDTQDKKNNKFSKQKSEAIPGKTQDSGDIHIDQLITKIAAQYGFLISKEDANAKKVPIITQILKDIGPLLAKLINKRKGSRVIQACLKYGNIEQRTKICSALVKEDSVLNETVKSKYGHFVILKMIKFCPQLCKDPLFSVIKQHIFSYLTQKESAAKVLDKFILKIATPGQLQTFKKAFESKKPSTEERVENLSMKLIENKLQNNILSLHVLSLSFETLIENEKEKLLEAVIPELYQIAASKEGLKLALSIVNFSNAKHRKNIVKVYKDQVMPILQNEQSKAYLLIQKLLQTVDDTKLLEKFILKEINDNIENTINSKNGLNLLYGLIVPDEKNKNDLDLQFEVTIQNNQSKKDAPLRKKEVLSYFQDNLINYLNNHTKMSLKNPVLCKICQGLIDHNIQNFEIVGGLAQNIVEAFIDDISEKDALINDSSAHRILKHLIQLKNESVKLDQISDLVVKHVAKLVKTKGIFVVIALIEHSKAKQKIIQSLKKVTLDDSLPGVKVLQSLLN